MPKTTSVTIAASSSVTLGSGMFFMRASASGIEDWALVFTSYDEVVVAGRVRSRQALSFSQAGTFGGLIVTNTQTDKDVILQFSKITQIR